MRSRRINPIGLLVCLVATSLIPLALTAGATSAAAAPSRPALPLAALTHAQPDPPTLVGQTRDRFVQARALVSGHKDRFADTWFDTATGQVTVGAVAPGAVTAARHMLDAAGMTDVAVVPVAHTAAELDAIVDGVYQVPSLEPVTSAWHDWANNRVILTASEVTADLRAAIFTAYGDAAVLHDTPETASVADSRNGDESAFYAGMEFGKYDTITGNLIKNACTMGFSWRTSTGGNRMLTAGHCFPSNDLQGGWRTGVRTDFGGATDDFTYRAGKAIGSTYSRIQGTNQGNGDLALVSTDVNPNGTSLNRQGAPRIWQGGPSTTNSYKVTGVVKWSVEGDWICFSGKNSGTQCGSNITDAGEGGFKVTDPTASYKNSLDGGVPVLQQVKATKGWGQCLQGGDSGAPVYDWIATGNVVARGIASGTMGGGNDSYVGKYEPDWCTLFYTDLGQAYQQWNGYVETTA